MLSPRSGEAVDATARLGFVFGPGELAQDPAVGFEGLVLFPESFLTPGCREERLLARESAHLVLSQRLVLHECLGGVAARLVRARKAETGERRQEVARIAPQEFLEAFGRFFMAPRVREGDRLVEKRLRGHPCRAVAGQ